MDVNAVIGVGRAVVILTNFIGLILMGYVVLYYFKVNSVVLTIIMIIAVGFGINNVVNNADISPIVRPDDYKYTTLTANILVLIAAIFKIMSDFSGTTISFSSSSGGSRKR